MERGVRRRGILGGDCVSPDPSAAIGELAELAQTAFAFARKALILAGGALALAVACLGGL